MCAYIQVGRIAAEYSIYEWSHVWTAVRTIDEGDDDENAARRARCTRWLGVREAKVTCAADVR